VHNTDACLLYPDNCVLLQYCPFVQDDIEKTLHAMWYCTLGGLSYIFTISLGGEVDVERQKTLLPGDEFCSFKRKVELLVDANTMEGKGARNLSIINATL